MLVSSAVQTCTTAWAAGGQVRTEVSHCAALCRSAHCKQRASTAPMRLLAVRGCELTLMSALRGTADPVVSLQLPSSALHRAPGTAPSPAPARLDCRAPLPLAERQRVRRPATQQFTPELLQWSWPPGCRLTAARKQQCHEPGRMSTSGDCALCLLNCRAAHVCMLGGLRQVDCMAAQAEQIWLCGPSEMHSCFYSTARAAL